MFDELRLNIEREKAIIGEMRGIQSLLEGMDDSSRSVMESSLDSYRAQLRMINNAVPALVANEVTLPISTSDSASDSAIASIPQEAKDVVSLSYVSPATNEKRYVSIAKADRAKFMKELALSETGLKGFRTVEKKKINVGYKPGALSGVANKFFLRVSERLAPSFKSVGTDLSKANMQFRLQTYLSLALLVSFMSFFIGIILFSAGFALKVFTLQWAIMPFAVLALSLFGFYIYPAMEKGSIERKISDELPFATIHMAAIAGSNIEPTKIFRIISTGAEYKHVGFEILKMLNQIDVFGYDLVTALKNAAKKCSNRRLAELFEGLATNIVSGGDLKSYLEKKAENLLLDYKLERQRYTALAETFMDIYISVLITAPLVLMMLFIIMNLTGLSTGLSLEAVFVLVIAAISLANIVFLMVLQFKQPK